MKKVIISLLILSAISVSAQEIGPSEFFSDLKYRNIGPARGGRVTAVAGIESRPNEFYMGATGGGVWKTTDYGQSWRNVSDGFFDTGSIGAIRVSQNNPDIVYAGTGSDGIRSNIIIGKGMYRSDDGGKNWSFIGLKDAGQIGAVLIHPDNPDICYVAAIGNPFGSNPERGVFRTLNSGKSWDQILFVSDRTGAVDLEFAPDNPDIIYASVWTVERKPWTIISGSEEGGVYKSIDGGNVWNKIENGLPRGIIGKSDLAVCKSSPGNLYVLIEAEKDQNGLYFSEDYGDSFIRISDYKSLLDRPFYYCNVDVDPNNPDIIFVNTTGLHKSLNKGKSWNRMSTPHGDNHDMWINPSDSEILIQSNDGGANVTRDGGRTWSPQSNQPTAELYQVNVDDQFPYWLYAGQQDNSTLAIPSNSSPSGRRRGGPEYIRVGGCETGPAVPKPGNHNIVYSNCKGRFGTYNKLTGSEKQYYVGAANMYGHNPKDLKYRFQRVAPIFVSPHNPDVVYHASQFLHRTMDDGVTWETISPDLTAFEADKQVISGSPITRDITGEEFYSTIYAVNESPLQEGVIWVGANDGPVHVTTDGGQSWTNVTPPDLPQGGRVQTIESSPHNPAKAYFATYRFLLNDWEPYIYKTENYGKSWTRLTTGDNGIPADFPARVIREDPIKEGLLYAGTEFGMFISMDDGVNWNTFQQNLPVVPITDIKIYRDDIVMSTMGRGFWIMDDISSIREYQDAVKSKMPYLFTPRIAYRSSATEGANIDYYLGVDHQEIIITIRDEEGFELNQIRTENKIGFHRSNWRLTAKQGDQSSSGRRYGSIKVVPGMYTVRLVLEESGYFMEKEFEVKADPRVVEGGMTQEDFQEQYELSLKVQELQNRARVFHKELDSILDKAVKQKGRKAESKYKALSEIRKELVTDSGPYPQPMLMGQISYLLSMISLTDQKPGRDAYIRLDELTEWLSRLEDSFAEIK